jgi:hypothetical protein
MSKQNRMFAIFMSFFQACLKWCLVVFIDEGPLRSKAFVAEQLARQPIVLKNMKTLHCFKIV